MNRGNFALEGDDEVKRNCCGLRGRGFEDFSREDLRDIILHKNKVIADLEEHAYGSASWIENLNKGIKKAKEIKDKVDKKPPKETDEEFRKRLEEFDKGSAPTEAWGADELNGGAAAPTPTEPKVSPVAAAAAALKPVREKIQNGIGDALYGKEDDPRKQKKGLLGISEEGKEESKKKVMKNIVVPIVKTATAFGKSVKDTANMIFNKDQYDADMKAERIQRIKKDEAQAGIVRDKANPMIIIRKPRGYWTAETTDPTEEAYSTKRIASINRGAKTQEERDKDVFYVRVPNPIFAAKLRPSFKEFGDARIKLWTGVQQLDPKVKEDVDGTLQRLHDDEFIWLPEDRAKEIYGQLRQFVADKQDEGVAEGFDDLGWTKGQLKAFAKIDPRTLKGQDLIDYKQNKLLLDRKQTENALEKVKKDIKDEEAKANPDTVRLGKMREAKVRVEKREKELDLRGQQEFKDMMLFNEIEGRKRDLAYKERMAANAAIPDEVDEFNAKPVAERIAILEGYIADPNANETEIAQFTEQIEQLRAEDASNKVEEQAQGSVDLLQQAQVGGAKPTNPALYEKAKAIVNKSYPKHSAYRSGAYVKKYKEMGGEYEDEPDGKRPLERWFKEDWKDVGNKEYPVYRPTKRISKDTPLTPEEIDPENLKLQIKEKQKIKGDRNLSAFEKRGGAGSDDDEELEGAGAIEYTLQKAGMRLFNPTRDLSKAERQSFTPDYDAYGLTAEQGRQNAFNLSRSMYDQSKAIELPDFRLLKDDTSLRFYRKDDENVILVGIRGTDVKSWTDLYTWAVIGVSADLRLTTRFQEDLAKLVSFQRNYPPSQFYYVATGSSLAGSIADRFLELGLIEEAITYNPSIERKHLLDENILNHRIYLDTDPLFILMGQYSPNTEIRINPNKTNYYNPSKEKDYLIASHSIYPVYNPAFEGGGMEGSGKTYTLEEWKAIFDAKLEEKRKAIEAREAKKKQTAKAKRERAKARREEREKPKAPEPAPAPEPEEEEEPEVEVAEYKMGDEVYWVEEPREGLAFDERRVFDSEYEEIGNLTVDDVGKTLVKMVMRREKIASPKAKSSSESLPFFESQQPKAPKAPKSPKAPASARVELREELVAEQPRSPAGEFAVAVAQPRPMTALPRMTAKQKEFFMNLLSRKVSATQKSILLARSGMSDKLIERLLPFITPTNRRDVMKQTGMITERVAEKRTDTDYPHLPADIKTGLRKLAQDIMNMKGRRPTMLDDARRTDTLKKMTETEKRQMLRRNFVAGVKSCEAIVDMTRTDMFGDYSCRRWEAGEPSYFKRVETSEYGVKKKCMAIGDDAGMPQGATLDQLKPVVGVGRDNAMMSSRMLAELSPSTWGVEDKPDAKFLSKGVPITKSTPDVDLAEHIRQTQRVWRLCIFEMLDVCGIKSTIQKEVLGTWKRGYGIIINWKTLQKDDKNLTKVKVREAQEEVNQKLSSPKLRDFLLDLRGFCAMVAEETEAEDEGDVAKRRKDEEERILMMRMESEITPDEEEERAKVRANPELKAKLWGAIRRDQAKLDSVFDTAPFSGDLRQKINRMKRIAGIDYNTGYGSVVPANFWVSGLKAKLPPIRKKDGYFPSVEQYIRDIEK